MPLLREESEPSWSVVEPGAGGEHIRVVFDLGLLHEKPEAAWQVFRILEYRVGAYAVGDVEHDPSLRLSIGLVVSEAAAVP